MSGGYFNYSQFNITEIADSIDDLIQTNDSDKKDEYGDSVGKHYPPEVIAKFQEASECLRRAYVYAHRVDYLVSDDDGIESFLERLHEELEALE